jgi:hypothetical protein
MSAWITLISSLKPLGDVQTPDPTWLPVALWPENYAEIWSQIPFLTYRKNSTLVAFSSTGLGRGIGAPFRLRPSPVLVFGAADVHFRPLGHPNVLPRANHNPALPLHARVRALRYLDGGETSGPSRRTSRRQSGKMAAPSATACCASYPFAPRHGDHGHLHFHPGLEPVYPAARVYLEHREAGRGRGALLLRHRRGCRVEPAYGLGMVAVIPVVILLPSYSATSPKGSSGATKR